MNAMRTVRLLACALAMWLPALVLGESRILLQQSPVMGFRHYDGRSVWHELRVGDAVTLAREPGNPFDPQAIRVDWQGRKLGYVPRVENVDLARLMDSGSPIQARIAALEKHRRPNNRVQVEVFMAVGGR